MSDPVRSPILFHPGASQPFRSAVLDAYHAVPPAVRAGLNAYAGARTIIRTVRQPFDNRSWSGLSISPAARRNAIRHDPSFLAITRWGRHHLTVAEYFRDGRRNPLDYVGETLHHEIGHRIDAAISGDNYPDGRTRQHERFSQSAEFIASIDQDLRDAGWRPGQALPPGLRIHPSLLPELGSNGRVDWSRAAQEIFADLYAWRFSTTLNDQSGVIETHRTDFGIFRRTGRLVDRAVATFAGQPIVPVNTNSGDYRPGE